MLPNTFSQTLEFLRHNFMLQQFKFPALSPVNLISLQPGLQHNLNIALELFNFFLDWSSFRTSFKNLRGLENLMQLNETKTRNTVHCNYSTYLWLHIFLQTGFLAC